MPLERRDWREAFRLFDLDGAGFIEARELFNGVRLLGYDPTEAEIQDLIAAGDKDGNGEIDYGEFQSILKRTSKDDDMKETFSIFDRDEDGFITGDEVHQLFSRFGYDYPHEYLEDVIKAADVDGDGVITYKDFIHAFNCRPNAQFFEEQTTKGLADLDMQAIVEDVDDEAAATKARNSEQLDEDGDDKDDDDDDADAGDN